MILFAYSRGITSSRRIAQACDENVCLRQSLTRAARAQRRHPSALHHDRRLHRSDGPRDYKRVHRCAQRLLHRRAHRQDHVCGGRMQDQFKLLERDGWLTVVSPNEGGATEESQEDRRVDRASSCPASRDRSAGARIDAGEGHAEGGRASAGEGGEGARVPREQR
ncbi:MAG: hypothetical protein ACLFP4_17470 [Spirochaetales bacterium]